MKQHRRRLIDRIRNRPPWCSDARVFRQHHQWGNACTFLSYEHGSVYGFGGFPEVGDVMLTGMKSGREAAFLFVKVERAGNPDDMWTGTVETLGYLDFDTVHDERTDKPLWRLPVSKRRSSIMDDLV